MAISVKNKKKYNLGLALSGGGARGFAHPGAIKAIENSGLRPEIIVGTSAGALAGVLYADGYTPEEIVGLFIGAEFKEFAEIQIPKAGIFSTQGFRKFLKKHLHAQTFEDLSIPLHIVTTNLDEGKSVVFHKGPLIEPVIASCSIPIVFEPVVIRGVNYVDGGIFKNFPVSVIRSDCEKVIGVNVSPMVSNKYNKTIMQIAERSYHYMSRGNTLLDRKLCDILIEMEDLISYKTFDLVNANKIFNIGYEHAKKALEK
ncbi:patatin-like phospholipase family protein [Bacteroidales bacterium OttesenSCG-928-M06]|nr:patatin-like phospholipase family protein [Bacteroidales bacterium OttesenSCG-928-M06]